MRAAINEAYAVGSDDHTQRLERPPGRYHGAMKSTRFLLVLSLLLPTLPAFAWGRDGHAVVAQIAQDHLTPQARATVDRLLALEPGATLVSIASWADEHRNPTTGKWHYVNFPRGSDMRYTPDLCPRASQCLVVALHRQSRVLGNRQAKDERRARALRYVVHLVGDAHQPLHAGYGDDKGGNTYQVRWNGRGSNLHHVWDTGLVETFGLETRTLATRVERDVPHVRTGGTVVDWVNESGALVASPAFYPPRKVSGDYMRTWRPVVEQRLMQAGLRLAETLNRLLG